MSGVLDIAVFLAGLCATCWGLANFVHAIHQIDEIHREICSKRKEKP